MCNNPRRPIPNPLCFAAPTSNVSAVSVRLTTVRRPHEPNVPLAAAVRRWRRLNQTANTSFMWDCARLMAMTRIHLDRAGNGHHVRFDWRLENGIILSYWLYFIAVAVTAL